MVKIPKINSIHFGGAVIVASLIIGGVIPSVVWLICGKLLWWLVILGVVILALFGVIFAIEMHQDNGKEPYYIKHLKESIPYDPEKQYAVIKSSICTGEQVAGFRNKTTREFTEVMLIKTPMDEETFRRIYGLEEIKKEY